VESQGIDAGGGIGRRGGMDQRVGRVKDDAVTAPLNTCMLRIANCRVTDSCTTSMFTFTFLVSITMNLSARL
jgi:hypothetical protein